MNIEIENLDFITTIHRKDTFTGLMLNFSANCPIQWKKGVIIGMLHRAYNICPSWKLIHDEFRKICDIMYKNGYSYEFLNKIIFNFLNKKCINSNPLNISLENNYKYVFKIPYIAFASLNFKRKLVKLFKNVDININVIFTSTKVGSYFSIKDRTEKYLKTNLVYQYNCLGDPNISYIGKTKRYFGTRVHEHIETDTKSSVYKHIKNCNYCNENNAFNNFDIIDSGNSDFEAKILEALHVSEKQPCMNKQLFNSGTMFTLNVF